MTALVTGAARRLGRAMGIPPELMPPTYDDFETYMDAMLSSDVLTVGQQAREIVGALFAPQVLGQPGLVVVISVEVRDVEEVGVVDPLTKFIAQLIVAREWEPAAEERWLEPRVAQDRSSLGFDEDAGVADRGGAHGVEGRGNCDRWVASCGRLVGQATGGSVYC